MSTLELVMDGGLGACFDAGDVVSHWVHACLGGVDLNNIYKLGFASV